MTSRPGPEPSAWSELHAAPRLPLGTLDREQVPASAGVYALYREDRAVWLGKSAQLRTTFGQLVLPLGGPAVQLLRRRAAEYLGISTGAAIVSGRYKPTPDDQVRITAWIRDCRVAWRACASESEAVRFEARLAGEPHEARQAPPR